MTEATHYIEIDAEAFDRIELIATRRKTTVARLIDAAINWMIDREAAA